MGTKLPFTQAGLKRTILAVESAGKKVVAVRPDGTVLVSDHGIDHIGLGIGPANDIDPWSVVEV